jgi:hypothetical protein
MSELLEDLKKAAQSAQNQLVRSLTLHFSEQLSNIQAHYLATGACRCFMVLCMPHSFACSVDAVIVTTISEGVLFVIFCIIYFVMRAFPMWYYKDYESEAQRHAAETIVYEKRLGIHVEHLWQTQIIHNIVLMDALAIFYSYGLWVVIISFHLWILWFYTTHYAVLRNGFWLTTFIAGAIFMWRPEAPPRLTPSSGVIDSIKTISGMAPPSIPYLHTFRSISPRLLSITTTGYPNYDIGPYDSCPSLHSAWSIIVAVGLCFYLQKVKSKLVAFGLGVFAIVYPILTFYALVVTGNHWVTDALAGIGAAVAGFALSRAPYFRDFCAYHQYHMMAYYQEVNVTPLESGTYQANDQIAGF